MKIKENGKKEGKIEVEREEGYKQEKLKKGRERKRKNK